MREYYDASGRLNIDLADDPREFSMFASRLEAVPYAKCILKLEGLDERYWDFDVGGVTLVLHSHEMIGVSIHVESGTNDYLLRRIASRLTAVPK